MQIHSSQPTGLRIVAVRYRGSKPDLEDERSLDSYSSSGVYAAAGLPYEIVEPAMPEAQRLPDEPANLGLMGGAIADAVAGACRAGQRVLMTGGDCSHITGIVGGLQDAHGPQARIGLVWFDAHGDFNTPNTTLSGMLGGMPVAVAAGLAYPFWREQSHIVAPLPTNRIVMVDVRNLDVPEEQLIRATDVQIARVAPGFKGDFDLQDAVKSLAEHCDYIYLHIDSDILDLPYVPNHGTREPDGPDMEQVKSAIKMVMDTGKVVAYAVVSVYGKGEGADISRASGIELVRAGLETWV